ncbi:hypothetical protein Aperf_G00000016749 [Anoplocephala perfoliata]
MLRMESNHSHNGTEDPVPSSAGSTSVDYYAARTCPIESPRASSPLYGFYHCQICKLLLMVPLNPPRLAVVCSRCLEATPVRDPPSDKCFYRCICYRLLLVPRHQSVFVCPRSTCHAVLVTEVAKKNPQLILNFIEDHIMGLKHPKSGPSLIDVRVDDLKKTIDWRTVSINCGSCKQTFRVDSDLDLTAEILCPKCENISALSPSFPRRISRQYTLISFLLILISSAVSQLS